MRVLQVADVSRRVACVDIPKSRAAGDIGGTNEHRRRRVRRIGHPVILMKRRDVPRDIRRNARNKFGQTSQFRFAVIEAGYKQRHDFDPDARAVQPFDGVEDWREPSAQLAVMTIVEAFEIDLVRVDVRSKIFEDAWCSVAVRHKRGRESLSSRFAKDGDGPFHGDERLVVGGDDELCTLAQRILNERVWRCVLW